MSDQLTPDEREAMAESGRSAIDAIKANIVRHARISDRTAGEWLARDLDRLREVVGVLARAPVQVERPDEEDAFGINRPDPSMGAALARLLDEYDHEDNCPAETGGGYADCACGIKDAEDTIRPLIERLRDLAARLPEQPDEGEEASFTVVLRRHGGSDWEVEVRELDGSEFAKVWGRGPHDALTAAVPYMACHGDALAARPTVSEENTDAA